MDLPLPEDGILNGQPELIRQVAVELLTKYVPSNYDDPAFQEIINGDYGGGGTTCGFLAHWLMWRLGCRVNGLVNRTDPDGGLSYVNGKNVARIRWNSYFQVYKGGTPLPGDIVFISNGPPATEHILIFLKSEGGVWTSADAGQTNAEDGKQYAAIRERPLRKGGLVSPTMTSRQVQGWIPIDTLPLTAPATLCGP